MIFQCQNMRFQIENDDIWNENATSKYCKSNEFFIRQEKPKLNGRKKLDLSKQEKKVRTSATKKIIFKHFSNLIVMTTVWWCITVENCVPVVVKADQLRRCPQKCSCNDSYTEIYCVDQNLSDFPTKIPNTALKLVFTKNNVKSLHWSKFQGLTELRILRLEENRISQIPVQTFFNLNNVITLNLASNKLIKVPREALGHLKNLQTLILRNNPIFEIVGYDFVQVDGRNTLLYLDLGKLTHLSKVSPDAFRGLQNLQILKMDSCNLEEIPDLFHLKHLQGLDLSQNRFTVVRGSTFASLKKLKNLRLDLSDIAMIEDNAFSNLPSLEALNLMQNKVRTLKVTVFDNSTNIKFLYLQENPWMCNCNLMPLAAYLKDNNFCSENDCPKCKYPPTYQGFPVTLLLEDKTPPCAAFIIDPPMTSFKVSEGNPARLLCPTSASINGVNQFVNVSWYLPGGKQLNPDGKKLSDGKYNARVRKLDHGSFNFTSTRLEDRGFYFCSITTSRNEVQNGTVYLNVTSQNYSPENAATRTSIFRTLTTSTVNPVIVPPKNKSTTTTRTTIPSSIVTSTATTTKRTTKKTTTTTKTYFFPLPSISTTTQTTTKQFKVTSKTPSNTNGSTNTVLGTTNVIIGCFVSLTLIAAILLIIFYRIRRKNYDLYGQNNSSTSDENDKSDYSNNQASNNDLSRESSTRQIDCNLTSPEQHPRGSRRAMTQSITGTWVATLPEQGKSDHSVRLPPSAVRVLPPTAEEMRARELNSQVKGLQSKPPHLQSNSSVKVPQSILRGTNKHGVARQSVTLPAKTRDQSQILGTERNKNPFQAQPLYANSKRTVKRCKEKSSQKNRDDKLSARNMTTNNSTYLRPKSCINLTQVTEEDTVLAHTAKGNYQNCNGPSINKATTSKQKALRMKSLEELLDHKETEI